MASGLEVAAAGCVGVGNKGGLLALTAIATPTKRALEKREPPELVPAFVAVPDIADAWSSKRASVTRANAKASPNVVGLTTNNSRYLRVLQIGIRAKVIENQGADDEEISEGVVHRQRSSQDEDECEPMFVQAHDPDYVPEPIYPEYIPLEDEHEFPAEEQPLPPVDSPTAESPGYVTESDPEEDPEEDDADGEDEDDEDEEEEEEHLAPADSAIVVPVDEPVFPPEGIELFIHTLHYSLLWG
ncbi:hypothetical protein Tco_0992047 [Tanacetum coccineum]|uniref:Uncharacterized protein n=1 Tax=Tanacetum coccineum TaxID=301880 RepID=A0ABQ5F1P6_9ASTR